MAQKHKPSAGEMSRAAEMMTPEQKIRSEAREEGFRLGETAKERKEKALDPAKPKIIVHERSARGKSYTIEAPEKPLYEKREVNGVPISVGWDRGYEDYTIYFDVKLPPDASDRGVYDQAIRISHRPDVAKQVFDFAAAQAEIESDPVELIKKVEEFARTLPGELDEEDEIERF